MGLDIRLPIGLMFCVLGPLLLGTGLVEGTPLASRTGAAMLLFGVVMLLLGLRGQRAQGDAAPQPASRVASSSSSSKETT